MVDYVVHCLCCLLLGVALVGGQSSEDKTGPPLVQCVSIMVPKVPRVKAAVCTPVLQPAVDSSKNDKYSKSLWVGHQPHLRTFLPAAGSKKRSSGTQKLATPSGVLVPAWEG